MFERAYQYLVLFCFHYHCGQRELLWELKSFILSLVFRHLDSWDGVET